MRQFIAVHANLIQGVLNGYDRMLFRGTLRLLAFVEGMAGFMQRRGILHKDFMAWSESVTERIKADAIRLAEQGGQPPIYLASSAVAKEEVALAEARRRGLNEGLIGVFSCVEPCLSYGLFRNREQRTLDLHLLRRKCLHYYFYWLHPALGLCHLRLQTWAPFSVQVCLNGRERLARQLVAAQIAHQQRDNCFVWIADVAAAQKLADAQLDTRWEDLLDGLLEQAFPARRELFPEAQLRHYWSLQQSEWATDLLFHRTADLERLYPPLVRQAMSVFQSDDILRFLGRVNTGRVFAPGGRVEVTSDLKRRPEGVRVKHRVGDNSLKIYNKEGSVLRVETTINEIRDFKECGPAPQASPSGGVCARAWRPPVGAPKSASKPTTVIWMRWPPLAQASEWNRCWRPSAGQCSGADGAIVACARGEKTQPSSSGWRAANFFSRAFAIGICAPPSPPNQPRPRIG